MNTISERDQTILRLYYAGAKIKDIAAEVGMAANSINHVLKKHGIERPAKPQKRWGDKSDQSGKIVALWKEGLCVTQIAERLTENPGHVGDVLSAKGLRSAEAPRHRYDGIGGICRPGRRDRSALGRIARRA